ncbi:flotillin family protein [Zymobacter sp. IVIA_12111.31 C1]|uniref:flotillin family protein n=1 Tax=Zymobacter sp. IVIA_12111.31 C1 TaxID=3394854 RepID=UPI0039C04DC1
MDTPSLSAMMIPAICVVLLLSICLFISKSYKKVPNNVLMVVYGVFGRKKNKNVDSVGQAPQKVCQGGGIFVIPFLQDYRQMSLAPLTVSVDLKEALTIQKTRVDIPATFTVAIPTDKPSILNNAINRLLGMTSAQIIEQGNNIIIGQLRHVISRMKIDDIISDRDKFLELVNESVELELNKIGLTIINVNIKDILDNNDVINSLGQRETARTIESARIDVSQQQRISAMGIAENEKEREIGIARAEAQKTIGVQEAHRDSTIRQAEIQAEQVSKENESKSLIAQSESELAVKMADARRISEIAAAEADTRVAMERQKAEQARIEKEAIPTANVDKRKLEIASEASAAQVRIAAQGEAEGIRIKAEAEAYSIEQQYRARSEGIAKLVDAFGGDSEKVIQLLLLDKSESLAAIQAEAIKNLKIDSLNVLGGGNGEKEGSGALTSLLKDYVGSVPLTSNFLNTMGYELPKYIVEKQPKESGVATDESL